MIGLNKKTTYRKKNSFMNDFTKNMTQALFNQDKKLWKLQISFQKQNFRVKSFFSMTKTSTKKRIFIVEYGYELFNKGGFSNITINKIAKAGHFSVMSIYYIFNSKEALQDVNFVHCFG